jgi:hypothetical protein
MREIVIFLNEFGTSAFILNILFVNRNIAGMYRAFNARVLEYILIWAIVTHEAALYTSRSEFMRSRGLKN